jgi:hypothetical protein
MGKKVYLLIMENLHSRFQVQGSLEFAEPLPAFWRLAIFFGLSVGARVVMKGHQL